MTQTRPDRLIVSVPWPLRLFGDLQEPFGLPSITAAVDIPTGVGAVPRSDGLACINAAGLAEPVTFDPRSEDKKQPPIPSFSGAVRALRKKGVALDRGFDFQVYTRVPAVERVLESPAMVAAWTITLLALCGRLRELSGSEVADFARAAFDEQEPRPQGSAEIVTCVLGGALFIRSGEKAEALPIERELPGLVLGYTRAPVVKRDHGSEIVRETRLAVGEMENFSIAETSLDEAIPRFAELDERRAGLLYAHLMNRDLCARAYEMIESEYGMDDDRFGEVLDDAHEMLRDYLGFHLPKLEVLMDAAKEAGALGCKIIPDRSSFVAFAPDREEAVKEAIRHAGGEACSAPVSRGMHVEFRPPKNQVRTPPRN